MQSISHRGTLGSPCGQEDVVKCKMEKYKL